MDLIVTHTNADFDAFSSLVAAKKLYPRAHLLLPGSQEAKVREFLSLCKDLIDVEKEKEVNLRAVKRLILVDTRHASRIGIAAKLLNRRKVKIIIYDHHPRTGYDIKATRDNYEEVGATVTMLVDRIRQRKIPITPLEATIMALGIYEETGSLTFRTTSQRDLDAARYLLASGATLSVVSSYLNRELTDEELIFLAKLMRATRTHHIKGIDVAITKGEADAFVGELASIVHRLVDVENTKVLFAFIKVGKKIYLIARSRLKSLDVNKIVGEFNGGGHPTAASAVIRDMTIDEAEDKLLKKLYASIKVEVFAKDIMSKPVITADMEDKVRDVRREMKRLGIKGMVVLDRRRIAGMITMRDLNKAMRHKFGHSRIKGYMSNRLISVTPDAPLHEIQRIMFQEKVGRLPVVSNGRLRGMVTRTDVMKAMYGDLFLKRLSAKLKWAPPVNIKSQMKKHLPADIHAILRLIGRLAKSVGSEAYIVGGFVRDLFLGVKNFDVDITVEPDGMQFAKVLARELNGKAVLHKRFGTASVFARWPHKGKEKKHPDIMRIDITTARTEHYEKPAALPQVKFSSIKDDLFRRDFTINAIAASLNPGTFGALIDFFSGYRDITDGIIRVLHDGSFIDDPTRIFRAVRFEQRFNFKIDEHTMGLIKNAVNLKMFEKVEKQRIRDEIIQILKERNPIKALLRMDELHEFRFIHPKIKLTKRVLKILKSVKSSADYFNTISRKKRSIDVWLIYFMALLKELTLKEVQYMCADYVFRKGDRLRILSYREKGDKVRNFLNKPGILAPSRVYKILEPLSFEVILIVYAEAKNKRARTRIHNFLTKYNSVRLKIKGDDLKQLGIKPGPQFKDILTKTLYAKIDGKIKTKKDEQMFALRKFRRR